MSVSLRCPDSNGELDTHATSVSAEHFISLTTGLSSGDNCVMFLLGLSSRNEILSYRMRVSELQTRTTPRREPSASSMVEWDWGNQAPVAVGTAFDKLAVELTRRWSR